MAFAHQFDMTVTNSETQKLNISQLSRTVVARIADLRLAIVLLLVIALFSISGTVIEQGQSLEYYQSNYPESPALFGFLTWKVLLWLGLNHVYSTWWYLSLLVLFGTSLTLCTFRRQIPALKAAYKWQFFHQPRQYGHLAFSAELDNGSLANLTPLLQKQGYKVTVIEDALYAYKGIIGRVGPIIVHLGIIIILLGGIWGALTGFMAQEMVASGNTFQVKNIFEAGPLSSAQVPKNWSVKVNRFWIEYTPKGEIDQFYSDLSVVDDKGSELDRKTIYVNQPLRYRGVTFYQTNWGISAVRVKLNNSPIFQLAMAELDTKGKGRLWGTWIPVKPDMSEGIALVAKDLQGTMIIYDQNGKLVDALRPGMSVEVNGVKVNVLELIGATGLQIKADPGVPIVYLGFALLMAGVVMSYVSHSQIWALQTSGSFFFGGKTNRAQVAFERELVTIIEQM